MELQLPAGFATAITHVGQLKSLLALASANSALRAQVSRPVLSGSGTCLRGAIRRNRLVNQPKPRPTPRPMANHARVYDLCNSKDSGV
jgi:hypothetical protein